MSRLKRTLGFSAVEAILIIIALVLIVAAGYLVFKQNDKDAQTPTASQQTQSGTAPAAPEVDDTGDLDAANDALDQTNVDASTTDSTDLDAQLNGF